MNEKIKENLGKILWNNDFCFTILNENGVFYLYEVDYCRPPIPDSQYIEMVGREIKDDSEVDWANVTFGDRLLYPSNLKQAS